VLFIFIIEVGAKVDVLTLALFFFSYADFLNQNGELKSH